MASCAAQHAQMEDVYRAKRTAYESLVAGIESLYGEDTMFEEVATERARALAD